VFITKEDLPFSTFFESLFFKEIKKMIIIAQTTSKEDEQEPCFVVQTFIVSSCQIPTFHGTS